MVNLGGLARRTGAYDALEPLYGSFQRARWGLLGGPTPPPSAVKRQILRRYARAFDLRTLVETGTYRADTVRALRRDFDVIYSIELDDALYETAVTRTKGQVNARIVHGDSATKLPEVLSELTRPALFWLDAHYSGSGTATAAVETPIGQELAAIFGHAVQGHVVLIDDLREFVSGAADYPPLSVVQEVAEKHSYDLATDADVIRLTPVVGRRR